MPGRAMCQLVLLDEQRVRPAELRQVVEDGAADDAAADRDRNELIPLVADACRRLHAGRPFLQDFDMFQIQRRYLGVVQERSFQLPPRYLEFERQVRAIEEAMRPRAEPAVPCNNDLLAEN